MAEDKKNLPIHTFFSKTFNVLPINIYVTDIETDEIVFINDAMKESFQLEHPEGQICYTAFNKGNTKRCSFCRLGELTAGKKFSVGDILSVKNGHFYKTYDGLFEWEGKIYHIQTSIDMTEYVERSESANMDELTRMLNRRAGKEKLAELIEMGRREQKILTVALYDVNQLKQVNDAYGHREGDHLLRYMSEMVKHCLKERDIIFRLSGDEFIMAFYDEKFEQAGRRMEQALERIREEREQYSIFYDASFSYGLTEVYPQDSYSVTEVIARADEQMYFQKRDYHIRQSKRKLMGFEQRNKGAEKFEFDCTHLYEALSASMDDYIFVGDLKNGVFRYPQAMVEEFGLPGEMVENAAAVWGPLIHPHDERTFLESNQEIADGRAEYHNIEYRARNVEGQWVWLRCRGQMIPDEEGKPNLFAGIITNLGKKNLLDHMTGLYNRFEFEGTVKRHLVDERNRCRMGIMLLDMDSFKNINDLYDRSFGDEVLRLAAQKISSLLPANARLYRMEGDEFALLIINGEPEEQIQIFASIRHKFHKQQEYEGKKYYCTLSAGYSAFPQDADNYLELMRCANCALEHSKLQGKNRLTSFAPSLLQEKERRLELTELLRESIERGFVGFSVNYQPQVVSKTGALFGAEALARWNCTKYGNVTPGEFIPLLEQSGLIIPLGRFIFYQAVKQCKTWCEMMPDFQMSVNVSYHQMQDGEFVAGILRTLEEFSLSPSNIMLELTETYLLKDDAAMDQIIQQLRGIGIRLAMDDFGTGYSSMLSLKRVPVDFVKIDRGFVKGITTDPFNATFIRAITELCHDVGKEVCLEGVETETEYKAVKNTGLELIQGFFFGVPVDAATFEREWLNGARE